MKSYKIMKNRKNAIFHYTCCKTRGQEEVQKPKRKKKKPEMESEKSNISFDLLQNMASKLLDATRGAVLELEETKIQYFVRLVAKHDLKTLGCDWGCGPRV